MPAGLRPNKKTAKILYEMKQTPKDLQQKFGKNDNNPGEERLRRWKKDSEMTR